MVDLTCFEYIKEIPEVITDEVFYMLACKAYNLGLSFFWFFITQWLIDTLFVCFSKNYRKGAD